MQWHYFQLQLLLVADDELDVFVDDQHCDWFTEVIVNSLQTESTESREDFGDEIILCHGIGRESWCGSLERRCKTYWLHRRLSEPQERLSHLLCQKAIGFPWRSL